MKVAILGAGAWGTALAISLCARHDVTLWARSAADCEALSRSRVSPYLPQVRLPDAVRVESQLAQVLAAAELIVVTTATSGLRSTLEAVRESGSGQPVVWACKGFEPGTQALAHEIVAQTLEAKRPSAVISGPSFALEVARGQPTAVVLASSDADFATRIAAALNSSRLRVYSSGDVLGVEAAGALKNVIAVAAGISDGLALGRNARAALITRGLAEIARLGVAMGGAPETFNGLAGLGDLVLTCTGDLSRNRAVGMAIAQGKTLEAALAELGHVAEGVHSARAAREQARARGVQMPITDAVCAVLFEGRAPREAVQQLLTRDPRPESA